MASEKSFQPELELIFEDSPVEKPAKESLFKKDELFHPYLSALIGDIVNDIKQEEPRKVPLEPKTSKDPFYLAQLRALELEKLAKFLDQVPVLTPGLPFEQDELPASELAGQIAINELNRLITPGIRNNRLAIATFNLVAIERTTHKRFGHYSDDLVLVSGIFSEFIFDKYGQESTLVVPLEQPRFLAPNFLRNMELSSVTMPVLGMGEWKYSC